MERQLQSKNKLRLRVLSLCLTGLAAFSASAQMSGTYTIDASSAASSTNFQNWHSFWRSLQDSTRSDGGPTNSGGISGAVTVNVKSNLTETSQIQFPAITGASSTNTITINGNSMYVELAHPQEVISFTGGDYFTFNNLTIRNTSNGTQVKIIRFSNGSDYNTFSKCTLEFSALTTGSSTAQAYVAFASSATSNTSTTSANNGTNCTISQCLMRTTNSNSPGPGFAICDQQGTASYSSTPTNNTFAGNTIQNFYQYAFFNRYTNGDQFDNNDVSRANATSNNGSSTASIMYIYYTYASNRSSSASGNSIHDLPFVGASASQGYTSTFYGFYGWYNYGSTTYRFKIKNNTLKNISCNSSTYISYFYYTYFADVMGNTVDALNNNGSNSTAYFYGWYFYYGQETNFSGNKVQNCNSNYYTYYSYLYQHSGTWNYCEDNVIQNNKSGYYTYCIYPYYGNWKVNRNKVLNNKINGSTGYIYCVAPYYIYNGEVTSNLVAGNVGQYGMMGLYVYSFNSGNYKVEVRQNTVLSDQATTSYPYNYSYGLYVYCYYHQDIRVTGNIISLSNGYGGYPLYSYNSVGATAYKVWDYNSYWINNLQNPYFYLNGNGGSSWSSFRSGNSVAGNNEYFMDPNFVDPANGDFRSKVFENNNSTPTVAAAPTDVNGATRNMIVSDRGAVENYTDLLAESTNFTVPATVCAGYGTSTTTITVKNLFATDTAKNFYVAYSLNGGTPVRELVTKPILYNTSGTITFSQNLQLNKVGFNRIAIFIDIPDDNRANDSFIFTTIVKPAPGGGKFNISPKPTWAYYQYGKISDVTVVNQPVYYDVNAPRAYTNSDYGTKWTASITAETSGGVPVSGASITAPSGSTDLELKYVTSSLSLEDETITLKLKISDLTNGCDTVLIHKVLIYPTIVPDFVYPSKICDGDAVSFDNKSTVKSGNMEFSWDFGTGNPADITEAPSPVFQFPAPGNYKVKMTAKTLPYGFPAWDSAIINVGPIPVVKFAKVNACEGLALQFTNQTTPISATYVWDFGDNKTSVAVNPTHTYTTTGAYTVTLKANLNGCIAETSQRAYQFDKPKASFSLVSGNCDNEAFVFENKSTIKEGLFGNNWDFNDGTVSTEDAPSHVFTSYGSKNVKLTTTSEFGCKDEIIKAVVVKESPVATFVNDPACSLTPTAFTNTTADVSGTIANYGWDFGDGTTSTAKSPNHPWTTLGPKTVMLTVTLDNGCKSSTSKTLSVGVQPKANFDAQNVCAGNPVIFENNTTWAQGNISYFWDFGDITTSTNSDPQKTYTTSVTTTYNVTLKASIAGGCEDVVTKQVTVNEAPQTCDFLATPDYAFGFFGVKLQPKNSIGQVGGQTGVTYTWVFAGGGTLQGSEAQYNFQDDGSYKVTMRAKVDATGCECSKTIDVVMNRSAVKELSEKGIAVYPNPNAGQFQIALTESFGKELRVVITSMAGKVVKEYNGMNNGLLSINASDLSDGIYTVSVRSGDHVASSKITISK